jgi:predicted nucleotidyltransferase
MTGSVSSLHIVSTSRASDGSFTAISEIGAVLRGHPYRLIGGVAVVLHQHRLGLVHPVRATADADFGVPPYTLSDDSLVAAVRRLGYVPIAGNRWRRPLDEGREATVDLLVPSYRTRLRSSVRHGGTNTTEVGGLAVALKRPAINITGSVRLSGGTTVSMDVAIPDAASMLGLKLWARRARDEDRDAIDLWTCMELLVASGQIEAFGSQDFDDVRELLAQEFGDDGPATRIVTAGVSENESARLRTRLRGLVRAINGSP